MTAKPEKRHRGRPKSLFKEPQPNIVRALDRGMTLLKALSDDADLSLSDLAARVDLAPSTTYRLLATLQAHGFVEFAEITQTWSIGIEAFRIGSTYLAKTDLAEAARDILRKLMEETGETANLAIADHGDVVFISQVETHNPIRAFYRAGTRGHMHASGIGKALLAAMKPEEVEKIIGQKGLPEFTPRTITSVKKLFTDLAVTRERGWSYDNEERYTGMRCIAASICNAYGEAIAGISVSGPAVRFSDSVIEELGPKVNKAAKELTRAIGGVSPAKS